MGQVCEKVLTPIQDMLWVGKCGCVHATQVCSRLRKGLAVIVEALHDWIFLMEFQ